MSGMWGEIAREELRSRGLLDFSEVLDEIRSLPRADVRAALAVGSAHCLARMRVGCGEADAVDLECAAAVESMWVLLTERERSNAGDWAWLMRLRERVGSDVGDRDLVAATLYAADALKNDDADAASWAVSRLIDERFSSVDEGAETVARTAGVDEFVRDCASPQVQSVLRRLHSVSQTLLESGVSPQTIAAVRSAFDAG
jgi:hypothetical protein